jgi:hypothetical protein
MAQIDGFTLLAAVSKNPALFDAAKAAAEKAAIDLVAKQMKGTTFSLENLQKIENALGREAFLAVTDNIGEKDLPKILKKIDPYFPGLKLPKNHSALLERFRSLSTGQEAPEPKPLAAPRQRSASSRPGASPTSSSRALGSKSMGAKRKSSA